MKKIILILLIFPLFYSCQDKTEIDEIVTVFKNHGFLKTEPSKIKEIILTKGVEGLKEIDPNCGFVSKKNLTKFFFKRGLTFPGFLMQSINEKFIVRKIFESSFASDIENFTENSTIEAINGLKLSKDSNALNYFIAKPGEMVKINFRNGKYSNIVSIKTSYPYFSIVWGFNIPEINSAYLRISSLSKGVSKIILSEIDKLLAKGSFNSVVIDLRSSSIGDIEGLIETLSLFASKDEFLFETVSDKKGYERKFYSQLDGKLRNKKIVLITDNKTSGFPGLLAGILKNLRKAIIVGESHSGNLSLVRTFRLKNGKYFSATVAVVQSGGQIIEKIIPDYPEKCLYNGPSFSTIPYPVLDRDMCYSKSYSLL